MVKTVVTPRVILAGVAALKRFLTLFISSKGTYLLSQKLNHDIMTMNTAGV